MKEKLENLHIGEILENVDVKDYTTFKVSANVAFLVIPNSVEDLITLVKFLHQEQIKYKVIGKGSNLIFVNPNYEGVLIKLDKLNHLKIAENKITVGAGYSLMKLALEVSNLGYTGMEWATGIPGNVGGSLVNNAGAYQSDMSRIVTSAKILTPDYKVVEYTNEEITFKYRSSGLQYKNDYICLEVELFLEKGDKKTIEETIKNRREKRLASQPLEYPSAGSIFRNPEGKSAWELIDGLGLKGKKIGDAEVSLKHANFIINKGNATGREIKELILEIKEQVKKEYDIDLIFEQEFVE